MTDSYYKQRVNLAKEIQRKGINNKKIIDAIRTVPRHIFFPKEYFSQAYEDRPLAYEHANIAPQPYIVAFVINAAKLSSNSKVLKIGAGIGYQASILGKISKDVYAIEISYPSYLQTKRIFKKLLYNNIIIKHDEVDKGWPKHAPFDVIIVSSTFPRHSIPWPLLNQLKTGGALFLPIAHITGYKLIKLTKHTEGYDEELLLQDFYKPLV